MCPVARRGYGRRPAENNCVNTGSRADVTAVGRETIVREKRRIKFKGFEYTYGIRSQNYLSLDFAPIGPESARKNKRGREKMVGVK